MLDNIHTYAILTGTYGFTSTTLQLNRIVYLFLELFDFTKLFFIPFSELVWHYLSANADNNIMEIQYMEAISKPEYSLSFDDIG